MASGIQVEGLSELRAGLQAAVARMPEAIHDADRKSAALVGERAQAIGSSLGSVAAKAAGSIAVLAAEHAIVLDEPYGWGAEKGAVRFHQFKAFLGSGDDMGYFLAPAVTESETDIERLYADTLDRLLKPAFPS